MNLITTILKQNGSEIVSALVSGAGMQADEAEAFLPEAGSALMAALTERADTLDLGDLPNPANVDRLRSAMDVGALASRIGVTSEQGSMGLATFLPMVLGLLQHSNTGDLLGLLGRTNGIGEAIGRLRSLGTLLL